MSICSFLDSTIKFHICCANTFNVTEHQRWMLMKTDKHIHTETATVAQRNSVAHDGIMRAQEQRTWCERSGRELLMCLFTPKIESRARRCDESITELAPVDLHSHVLLIQCEEFQDQLSSIRIKLLLRFFSSRHTDV